MQTWIEADSTLCEIARIDVQVAKAKATKDRAQLEAENDFAKTTAPLIATRAVYVGELEAFYKTQRKKVEAEGRRSVDLSFGRLGMRKGNPTLVLLKGWKWEKVLAEIKTLFAKKTDLLRALVNTKESCNKDGIKAQLDAEGLAQIGLKVKQDDEFFYETFPEKVNTSAAA